LGEILADELGIQLKFHCHKIKPWWQISKTEIRYSLFL